MDTSILRSGPASVNTIGDNMDCNLSNAPATDLADMHYSPPGSVDLSSETNYQPSTQKELPEDPQSFSFTDVTFIIEQRRRKRREKEIRTALENTCALSPAVQDKLLEGLLAGGWGRFAHCIARHFKAPGRYGHKMIDIALITTVYDRTVASVDPVIFAAISVTDFEDETGMNESNIRKALSHLVEKGVLLKFKVSASVIFWGLNSHFFALKAKSGSPQGKITRGKLPWGNAPRNKDGNSPRVKAGQITPGQSTQSSGNQREISSLKNLLKESKKESFSSGGDFPEDMLGRWLRFQESGQEPRVKREREIFERMFIQHKDTFFHFCGRVVECLEKRGIGKAGHETKIHCPMSWIEGHWESNLARYRQWKAHQVELEQAHSRKIDREAKEAVEKTEKQRLKAAQEQEDVAWKEMIDGAALRFMDVYSTEEEVMAFAQEAIDLRGNDYIRGCFEESGWEHKAVRSCVVEHFMKVESGESATKVCRAVQEERV